MVRLFTSSFRNGGELKPADRDYVSKVVAARTGLSQADADKRVNDVVTQVKADTDAARKATAQLAFWLTASLLLGAFCASLAATEGGGLRDGTWRRRHRPITPQTLKGKSHAHSALVDRNPDSADHPDPAAALDAQPAKSPLVAGDRPHSALTADPRD